MAAAIRTAMSLFPLAPGEDAVHKEHYPIEHMELVLAAVRSWSGDEELRCPGRAARRLREAGHARLAARLQRLSKIRNKAAHPDVGLAAEISALGGKQLAEEDTASTATGGEELEEAKQEKHEEPAGGHARLPGPGSCEGSRRPAGVARSQCPGPGSYEGSPGAARMQGPAKGQHGKDRIGMDTIPMHDVTAGFSAVVASAPWRTMEGARGRKAGGSPAAG